MIVERLLKVALLGSTWVLYLLLVLSVVSLTAALERWLFFRKHKDDIDVLQREIADALVAENLPGVEKLLNRSPSLEARVVRAALWWVSGGPEAVGDAIEAELARTKKELERSLNLLGTLGNNAPFVGLLGTVIGVIEAFHQLGDAGKNQGAMGNVMAGIAEALVATGVGLFVALPAVVIFNLIQKKVDEIETGVHALGKLLTTFIRARDYQRDAASRAPRHAAILGHENGVVHNDTRIETRDRPSAGVLVAE
ncbi:MAG TPA: MotA/TolQ/ExbB proton channel family protein [Polyangiaceae bacterium]|nr:MotA/TolQ/ExbB proton channel family protein [Polyangiaceae bacterium]